MLADISLLLFLTLINGMFALSEIAIVSSRRGWNTARRPTRPTRSDEEAAHARSDAPYTTTDKFAS